MDQDLQVPTSLPEVFAPEGFDGVQKTLITKGTTNGLKASGSNVAHEIDLQESDAEMGTFHGKTVGNSKL